MSQPVPAGRKSLSVGSIMSSFRSLIAASSAVASLTTGSAFAGTFTPPGGTMLNSYPVTIYQEVVAGFIVPGSSAVSTAPGLITVNYCFDAVACVYGSSNVTLGADPTISHESHATGIGDDSVGGGESGTTLQYSIELFDNPGNTAPETVGFKGNDYLNAMGVGGAFYRMTITGPTKALDLQDSDGNIESYRGIPFGSLSSVTSISLVPNTIYSVKMEVDTFNGSQTGNGAYAEIDPEFFLPPGSTGTLGYSPGVTSPAPEPASWAMMLVGFAGVAVASRERLRRRRMQTLGA